ncbi:hypothetical protein CBS76997_9035 [Aspergillus niger]|nr:hypothetical protein CBS13152_6163 [Aspergillus niger]KAI3037660.1 hypothetical protein CBS76997_9035 [Aspergillus niger]
MKSVYLQDRTLRSPVKNISLATMATTVSITSDLEPYLASLRSYLAKNKPQASPTEDPAEDSETNTSSSNSDETAQREQPCRKGSKNNDCGGRPRPVMKMRSCRTH